MQPVRGFRISQVFGINPQIYAQFGLKGHNGIDFATPVGTPVYAPESGVVQPGNQGKDGYGIHVRIFNEGGEHVLAHLSGVASTEGYVNKGDLVGYTGNTGFSTGPHLHWGYRRRNGVGGPVLASGNGYLGYIDQSKISSIWEDSMDARIVRLYRQDDSPQVWAWVAVDSPDFFSRYGKGWDDVETVKIKPRLIRFAEEKAVYLGTYIDDFKQAAPYGLNPGEVEVVIDNMKYASGLAEAHTDKELAKKEAQEWRSNTEKLADSFEKLLQEAEEMKVRESAMEAELEERRKLVAELREDLRRYQTVPLPEDPSAGELFIRFIRKIFGL